VVVEAEAAAQPSRSAGAGESYRIGLTRQSDSDERWHQYLPIGCQLLTGSPCADGRFMVIAYRPSLSKSKVSDCIIRLMQGELAVRRFWMASGRRGRPVQLAATVNVVRGIDTGGRADSAS